MVISKEETVTFTFPVQGFQVRKEPPPDLYLLIIQLVAMPPCVCVCVCSLGLPGTTLAALWP